MNLFFKYLKSKILVLTLFAIFFLIFLLTFTLYHLPLKALVYPGLLSFAVLLAFLVLDFLSVKKKHFDLSRIKDFEDLAACDLPKEDTILDEEYKSLVLSLLEAHKVYKEKEKRSYQEMIDYYTVWAHQIKTPIAAMRLRLQNEDSNTAWQLLTDLFRIEQYVEMVMTYLRMDEGSTDYLFKEYDLDKIIRSCVKKFSQEFISRKIKLDYEATSVSVLTDEKWLSFVIEQILSNALKYTKEGSITICVSDDKVLTIKDTGIGISKEDLPRIFENGFTGCNGRIDKKASGIGLYLCKKICDNLGHRIKVESTLGEGTKVTIDLQKTNLTTM